MPPAPCMPFAVSFSSHAQILVRTTVRTERKEKNTDTHTQPHIATQTMGDTVRGTSWVDPP